MKGARHAGGIPGLFSGRTTTTGHKVQKKQGKSQIASHRAFRLHGRDVTNELDSGTPSHGIASAWSADEVECSVANKKNFYSFIFSNTHVTAEPQESRNKTRCTKKYSRRYAHIYSAPEV